jgi:hypothetical protein
MYDGQKLIWYPSPSMKGRTERLVGRSEWHKERAVIVSSQLVRRQDRADDLLATAEPWDLMILDEAHHARRRSPGAPSEGGPNRMLRLMQRLRDRTQGLVLLTLFADIKGSMELIEDLDPGRVFNLSFSRMALATRRKDHRHCQVTW